MANLQEVVHVAPGQVAGKRKKPPGEGAPRKQLRVGDLKKGVRFVCHAEYPHVDGYSVGGLCLCIVESSPDRNGDFAVKTYKGSKANDDPLWPQGKHYPPIGREGSFSKVNVRNVVVVVAALNVAKTFPKAVISAILTHPAYRRMGKKTDSMAAASDSEDDDVPLGVRVRGESRLVSA